SVDVACLVGGKEQGGTGDLDRFAAAPERIQLTDAVHLPFLADGVVHRFRHAGFDETRADRVDANICASELLGGRLDETDHTRFGRGISRAARARAEPRDTGGTNNRSTAALLHHWRSIFD